MWVHLIAVVSLALICIAWFGVQRLIGRTDAGSCSCTQKTLQDPTGKP